MRLEDMEEEPPLTGGRLGAAEERIRDGDLPLSFSTEEHGTVAAEVVKDAGAPEPADLLAVPLLLKKAECHGADRTDIYPRLQGDEKARAVEVRQRVYEFEGRLGSGHPRAFRLASASRIAERKAPRAMSDGSAAARAANRSRHSSHASRFSGSPLRTKSARWQAILTSPSSPSLRARSRIGEDPVAATSAAAIS